MDVLPYMYVHNALSVTTGKIISDLEIISAKTRFIFEISALITITHFIRIPMIENVEWEESGKWIAISEHIHSYSHSHSHSQSHTHTDQTQSHHANYS